MSFSIFFYRKIHPSNFELTPNYCRTWDSHQIFFFSNVSRLMAMNEWKWNLIKVYTVRTKSIKTNSIMMLRKWLSSRSIIASHIFIQLQKLIEMDCDNQQFRTNFDGGRSFNSFLFQDDFPYRKWREKNLSWNLKSIFQPMGYGLCNRRLYFYSMLYCDLQFITTSYHVDML